MRVSLKQLKRFIVETKSGIVLGKVYDVVLQTDGQLAVQYIVKSSMLGGKEYLVSRDNVVDFKENKLIVDDNVLDKKDVEISKKQIASSPEPALMRKTE